MEPIKKARRFIMSDRGSVRTRIIRSGIWVGIGEAFIQSLSFVRSIILARLLTPEVFGLMGLCGLMINTIRTFTRPGIGEALIQRKESFESARDTAFTLLVIRGAILTCALFLAAPMLARFFETDDLHRLLQVLAVVFFIGGFTNINAINRRKELDFRRLTYLHQMTALIGTVVTVGLVFWLRNVWALIIGQIAEKTTQVLVSYFLIEGKPRFAFSRKVAVELLSYGKFITATSAVIFIASSVDTAVIGKLLGAEQLGFYVLAITIANLVTARLSKLVSGVMFPAYSKLQSDKAALRHAYLKTMTFVTFVCLPATIGLVITADSVVLNLYGSKWTNSILLTQILVVFGMLRAVHSINGFLLQGIGKPQFDFYISLVKIIILIPLAIVLTLEYGLFGTATAVTIAMFVQMVVSLSVVSRVIAVSPKDTLLAISGPLWKSLLMGVFVIAIGNLVDKMTGIGLAIQVLVGSGIYAVLNLDLLRQIRQQKT